MRLKKLKLQLDKWRIQNKRKKMNATKFILCPESSLFMLNIFKPLYSFIQRLKTKTLAKYILTRNSTLFL